MADLRVACGSDADAGSILRLVILRMPYMIFVNLDRADNALNACE